MLRYTKQYLPISTVKTMCKSLVEPYFRYCCPICGNAGVTVIENLQKLQNRAAKLVTNSPFDATALPIIRPLQWPTVRELIDFEFQKIVFRSLKGDAPSYINDMFTRVNSSIARSLSNAEVNLRLPLLKSAGGGGRNTSRTEALSFGTVLVLRLQILQHLEPSRGRCKNEH